MEKGITQRAEKVLVLIEPEQKEALDNIKKKTGATIQFSIRKAIENYINKKQ